MPLNNIEHFTQMANGLIPTKRGGWLERLLRRLHRRGYGVQSPWAFQLVCDALFEPLRYYAFDTLGGSHADEQLFRLATWLRSERMLTMGVDEMGERYLRAARPAMSIVPFSPDEIDVFFAREPKTSDEIDRQLCAVVEQIDGANRTAWTALLAHPRTTSTFDLGTRGIAFFNPAHQRQNYLL